MEPGANAPAAADWRAAFSDALRAALRWALEVDGVACVLSIFKRNVSKALVLA